jgi:hypothetical protein
LNNAGAGFETHPERITPYNELLNDIILKRRRTLMQRRKKTPRLAKLLMPCCTMSAKLLEIVILVLKVIEIALYLTYLTSIEYI